MKNNEQISYPFGRWTNSNKVLNQCELNFISSKGHKFTWTNNRKLADFIKEKLDRVVVNSTGMSLFSESF